MGELQREFQQAVESVEHALRLTEVVIGWEGQRNSGRGMDNLHQAIRVLKELIIIIMQAGHFWKPLQIFG